MGHTGLDLLELIFIGMILFARILVRKGQG